MRVLHNSILFLPFSFSDRVPCCSALIFSWLGIFLPTGFRHHVIAKGHGSHDLTEQADYLMKVSCHSIHLQTCCCPILAFFGPILLSFSWILLSVLPLSLFALSTPPPSSFYHTIRLYCLLFLKPKQKPSLDCCSPLSYFLSFFSLHKPASQNWHHILSPHLFPHLPLSFYSSASSDFSWEPASALMIISLPGHFLHRCVSFTDPILACSPHSYSCRPSLAHMEPLYEMGKGVPSLIYLSQKAVMINIQNKSTVSTMQMAPLSLVQCTSDTTVSSSSALTFSLH